MKRSAVKAIKAKKIRPTSWNLQDSNRIGDDLLFDIQHRTRIIANEENQFNPNRRKIGQLKRQNKQDGDYYRQRKNKK